VYRLKRETGFGSSSLIKNNKQSPMPDLYQLQLVFLLLLVFVAGFGALAQRMKVPYPILLVIGGLLISFIPHLPRIALKPEYVFLVILPPLLYSAAFETSWRDFLHNIASIGLLAVGLVAFTTIGVGLAAHWLLPGFDWRLGLALGAILSPTDSVAATSIAKRLGLPQHITDILEGESLVNDASGLVALKFATALVVSGSAPGLWQTGGELIYIVVAGIAAGLLIGGALYWFEQWVDNAPIEITLSIVTPYLAYMGADQIHASGILAVVACGLYLGRRSSLYLSSEVRLQAWSTWNSLTFIFNGLVFLLIGLQIRLILAGIRGLSRWDLFDTASITIALLILLRIVWVFPANALAARIRRIVQKQTDPAESPRAVFVIGWTGMRGVVSLAAALSLPASLDTGAPFPQREVIIFITFCVIFTTLVLQGLTLPLVIRALGLSGDDSSIREEVLGRRRMLGAALRHLEKIRNEDESNDDALYDSVADVYRRRLRFLRSEQRRNKEDPGELTKYRAITSDLRAVERQTIVQMRDEHKISDGVLRKLERELDLLEARFPRQPEG
jgi:CPA1 family monovalent cation:H+ antiporter